MVAEAKNFQEETKRIETLLRRVLTEKKQMEKALSKSNMMLQTQQVAQSPTNILYLLLLSPLFL